MFSGWSAWWQATTCDAERPALVLSCGTSRRTLSAAKGQRGWNAQPLRGLTGLGTAPASAMRSLRRTSVARSGRVRAGVAAGVDAEWAIAQRLIGIGRPSSAADSVAVARLVAHQLSGDRDGFRALRPLGRTP